MELIQPNDEKSIFAEFLRLYEEGLHYEKAKARFRDIGITIAQSGSKDGQEFIYYNSLNEFKHIMKICS